MAQSAIAKSPIGVTLYWDNGPQPNIVWEKWFETVKLAITAKENIQVEKLLRPRRQSAELDYPHEPCYEPPTSDETTAEKRQREQRNIKRKVDWQNQCLAVEDKGPYIDNTPWDEADTKIKSLIYLSLGQEATNIFHQRNPHTEMSKCTTDAIVEQLKETFKEVRNETFDRFQFFNCKQEQNESLEKFHSRIKQKAALCNWEALEDSLVKSIFIQGMRNPQIQLDLLSEDRDPIGTLQYALAREKGQENQQKMTNTSRSQFELSPQGSSDVQYIRRNNTQYRQNIQQRTGILQTPKSGPIPDCWKCGYKFIPGHLSNCPAKNEICRICKKIGYYAKMCRAEMPSRPTQKPPIRNNIRNRSTISTNQNNNYNPNSRSVRNIKTTSTEDLSNAGSNKSEEDESIDPENACYIKEMMEDWNTINLVKWDWKQTRVNKINKTQMGEYWLETQSGKSKIHWLVDTGSPRSFISQQTANTLINKLGKKIQNNAPKLGEFRCFNNNKIKIISTLNIHLSSGNSVAKDCEILVVPHNTVNLLGRDILQKLGIHLTQTKQGEKTVNFINPDQKQITHKIFKNFPHLCTRLGKTKNHIAKSTFKQYFKPTQHKGRRVPIHLIDKVEKELRKLIEDKQIIKLEKCSDEYFISPVVITGKSDNSIKIALNSKELNEAIHKYKYQMQSIDHLMDTISKKICEQKNKPSTFYFSKIDLKYAYSQIPLHKDTQKHCNFNILGGNATGTYRFINGFYGLTDMPATFQKAIDYTLNNINSAHAFLDDIIIITEGSLDSHEKEIMRVLSGLDKENLAISLHKCEFAQTEIIWLGYRISPNGIIQTEKKTKCISEMDPPHTLKQLRSFMGSIHHMIKFIPNLAELTAPLRPLLSTKNSIKGSKLKWASEHDSAFNKIKTAITHIIENKHFDTSKPTRVRCDASKNGLGACLEQYLNNNWYPIAYASRFLNNNEQKYSTNKLELLAVVWSLEHFKYYLYGSKFELQTDHQALLSALKNNRGNKTYQSRLTRWVDRLLPFHFTVQHVPGKNMRFADYFSRYPISPAPQPLESDKNYVVNLINTFKYTLKNAQRNSTNQNAQTIKHRNHDVIKTSKQSKQNIHAFCQKCRSNQSHSCNHFKSSLHNNSLNSSKTIPYSNYFNSHFHQNSIPNHNTNSNVFVSTRNKPYSNTFNKPIYKRPQIKKMNPLQENTTANNQPQQLNPPRSVTIATQTDTDNNLGKRLTPLDPTRAKKPFDNTQLENNIPLSNLHKVMNENFISEAIKLDNQSNRIRKMIQNQDWLALKHYSRYWHTLKKDLSVNENGKTVVSFMMANFTYLLIYAILHYNQSTKPIRDRRE